MAMTFNSQGCREAATNLNKSANTLDDVLNGKLGAELNKAKELYQSEAADELSRLFEQLKKKFPEFIKSVTDCSNYLSNTVAPAYEKVEASIASKVG